MKVIRFTMTVYLFFDPEAKHPKFKKFQNSFDSGYSVEQEEDGAITEGYIKKFKSIGEVFHKKHGEENQFVHLNSKCKRIY